jgi:hypothetical protein
MSPAACATHRWECCAAGSTRIRTIGQDSSSSDATTERFKGQYGELLHESALRRLKDDDHYKPGDLARVSQIRAQPQSDSTNTAVLFGDGARAGETADSKVDSWMDMHRNGRAAAAGRRRSDRCHHTIREGAAGRALATIVGGSLRP